MALDLEDLWILCWKGLLTSVALYALASVVGNLLEVHKALRVIAYNLPPPSPSPLLAHFLCLRREFPCRQINWFHPGGSVLLTFIGALGITYPGPGRVGFLHAHFSRQYHFLLCRDYPTPSNYFECSLQAIRFNNFRIYLPLEG